MTVIGTRGRPVYLFDDLQRQLTLAAAKALPFLRRLDCISGFGGDHVAPFPAQLDGRNYPTGSEPIPEHLQSLRLNPHEVLPKWMALGVLQDMVSCCSEDFDGFTIDRFDGTKVTICPSCTERGDRPESVLPQ